MTKVFFDLDGTLFNLYGKENWLEMLREENPDAFDWVGMVNNGFMPEFNYEDLVGICLDLIEDFGVEFNVITWLPMYATSEYEKQCAKIKEKWIRKFLPFVKDVCCQSYGTPKQLGIKSRSKEMILIDDNLEVCKIWETKNMRKYMNVKRGFNAFNALTTLYTDLYDRENDF